MLWGAIFFLLGNLWVQCSATLLSDWVWPWMGACGVGCLLGMGLWRSELRRWTSPAAWAILAFLLGFVWTGYQARQQLSQDLASDLQGEDVLVEGYIASLPESESYGQRFEFVVDSAVVVLPRRLQLTWYAPDDAVEAAQRWQLCVRLRRRHGYANPGGYDYEAQLLRAGIGATGYVRTSPDNRYLGIQPGQRVLKARAWLVARIAAALPSAPMQGVVRGLAVGDQQAISSDAWQVFARTGVSHLLAISGFHIGMVALLCAWCGRWLIYLPRAQRWRWTAQDCQSVVGLSGAVLYSLLAGMSVPTQRTLIMIAVYSLARLTRRAANLWHVFGLALLLVLLVDPLATLSAGAWLSFGAVAIILLNQYGRLGRGAWWREFLKLQIIVTLGLTPLLWAAFGNVSLVAPWVNLVAIPLFTVVLAPGVLLGCVCLWLFPALGVVWLQAIAWLSLQVFHGLQWAAQLPWAVWHVPQLPSWLMMLLAMGTIVVVVPWHWTLRAMGALVCLLALWWRPETLPVGAFRMTTLDVGQGLAVVIQTHEHVLLYDTGPVFQSGRDTGELVVLPYLWAQGIRRLDMLVASHGDADHVGGLRSVVTGISTVTVLRGPSVSTPPELLSRTHWQLCQYGQSWQWDGVVFTVLHPHVDTPETSDNNTSCVLKIEAPGGSALLLGDIEQRVERQLVQQDALHRTTIVEVAHHGSRSSSTAQLVTATRPQWVVFSTGYRNRWGFPKQDVVQRWQESGAQTADTATAGAVTFTVTPDGHVLCERYRTQHARYWQLSDT